MPKHDHIFDCLKQAHDLHCDLFDRLAKGGEDREALFARLHIDDEVGEHFPDLARYVADEGGLYMRSVFERRKQAEKALAEVTPEKLEDGKA